MSIDALEFTERARVHIEDLKRQRPDKPCFTHDEINILCARMGLIFVGFEYGRDALEVYPL